MIIVLIYLFDLDPNIVINYAPVTNQKTNNINTDKSRHKKNTKNQIEKTSDKKTFSDKRLVNRSKLLVKESDSSRSKTIDTIYFGLIVKLIKKDKAWSKIEYLNNEKNLTVGWVFSRYLEPFH